jgi:DNA-binding NarL/FixJ family response regulator
VTPTGSEQVDSEEVGEQRSGPRGTVGLDHSPTSRLTPRELQIAMLLTEGRTTREAATDLFLSPVVDGAHGLVGDGVLVVAGWR